MRMNLVNDRLLTYNKIAYIFFGRPDMYDSYDEKKNNAHVLIINIKRVKRIDRSTHFTCVMRRQLK